VSQETWDEGIRRGEFKNPGTMKKKKTGKPPPRPRGLRKGIRKIRMENRRER
jgi:hypothetical protein